MFFSFSFFKELFNMKKPGAVSRPGDMRTFG